MAIEGCTSCCGERGVRMAATQPTGSMSRSAFNCSSKLPRRRKMVVTRSLRVKPTEADQAWTMDFVADQLSSGAKIRALTIVDVFSREALAIEVGSRLRSEHVVGCT